ncbi:hypothetical protein [Actinomadura montaniterrae]|uniref:Uncharacterized protein n=1 Tax=Actinomadura montaniterrae TaxID=1803903 RepID=A0A6L3VRN1_9ACTN|nr:hypothetical protein [Actinomadura montaniterrae]KAB2379252.1 hypothetical protein F9B16_21300 [Actinomadura montaniterrae]
MNTWGDCEGKLLADATSYVLVERYGHWAVGWRWARDEGDFDRSPVGSWRCPRDSITTPEEAFGRVVAGAVRVARVAGDFRRWV